MLNIRSTIKGAKLAQLEALVGAAIGMALGDVLSNSVQAPEYVWGTGLVVGGGGIAYVGGANPFVRGFGIGTFAAGVLNIGQDAKVLQGIAGNVRSMLSGGSASAPLPRRVAGFRDVVAVGAFPKPGAVGKVHSQKAIYRNVY